MADSNGDARVCSSYLGRVRISLSCLKASSKHRGISRANVDRLKRIFSHEGCLRTDGENFLPCVIDPETLRVALELSSLTSQKIRFCDEACLPPPLTLPANARLECLHGQHRLLAAKEYLDERDQWWIVNLYNEGELLRRLRLNF